MLRRLRDRLGMCRTCFWGRAVGQELVLLNEETGSEVDGRRLAELAKLCFDCLAVYYIKERLSRSDGRSTWVNGPMQ